MNDTIKKKIADLVPAADHKPQQVCLLRLETTPGAGRTWRPYGSRSRSGLSKTARSNQFYQRLTGMMKQRQLGKYQHVLDIGQDMGDSIMWLSSITENISGVDVDSRIIDLSRHNFRQSGQYRPDRHDFVVLPEKSLIDIDQLQWQNVDLVKIDAGARTLFVLEALVELLQRNRPQVFICHSPDLRNEDIWNFLIRDLGYFGHVISPDTAPACPELDGTMIAYAHIGETDHAS